MSDSEDKQRSDADAELEREIRKGRKFTLQEAIGRLAGPGAMKGESPVPRLQQAEVEIGSWLTSNLKDAGGALSVVLHRDIKGSELLLKNFEHPMAVLADYCRQVLDSEYRLQEIVRNADVEWGRIMPYAPCIYSVRGMRRVSDRSNQRSGRKDDLGIPRSRGSK